MELFEQLSSGTTFLTPNRRLSASYQKIYQQSQIQKKNQTWESLDILPYINWLERLWLHYTAKHIQENLHLLTSQQEQIIWQDIILASPQSEYLLQIAGTAEMARNAWATLKHWRVDIHDNDLRKTEDSQIFQQWAIKFENLCQQHRWLDSNSLSQIVAEKIKSQAISLPTHIVLLGFTEISPLFGFLLDQCKEQGCQITHFNTPSKKNSVQRISLATKEDEILCMARWAKAIFDENPKASIGCTIPQLENSRDMVIRLFSEVFTTNNIYSLDYTTLPFNISAGKTLAQYPVIYTALKLLALNANNTSLDNFTSILHTPFIGEAETEMLARAQFNNTLRKANLNSININKLIQAKVAADKKTIPNLTETCPALAKRIQDYLKQKNSLEKTQTTSQWAVYFNDLLTLLGWPGERSLNSHEYQTVESWLDLLNDFAKLEHVLNPLSFNKALEYLNKMCVNKIFQPKSPDAPIQILGILEALEIPFDYLWVMGLDDTAWPPIPKPNPFIPQRLQKALNMPHATAERELLYCQTQTEQLKAAADKVIFSHAKHDEDVELRASPLITNLIEISQTDLNLANYIPTAKLIFASRNIEILQDDKAAEINQAEKVDGGASIFKAQAACPFKAFAEHRLHARAIDPPSLGFRLQERGKIMHKALELIWSELKEQRVLLTATPEYIQQLVKKSIETSINTYANTEIQHTRYREIETQRLESIILEWLELEKERSDFTIFALEQERTVTIGKLSVTLYVDRIDKVVYDKKIIIDYKTGANNDIKAWFGDRPDEPQLPLYCITDKDDIIGLLFAQINSEQIKWEGLCAIDIGIPTLKTLEKSKYSQANSWLEQKQQWQLTLENLSEQFYQGHAAVHPKKAQLTCRHCDLKTLCRIHEKISDNSDDIE